MATTKANPEDSKKTTYYQVIGLLVLLFILMSTSVVTALMAMGVINVQPQNSTPVNSMTDAMFVCDKALLAEHGDRLQISTLDDLSSRPDAQAGGFMLFYELNLYRDAKGKSGVNKFYVNCFVSDKGRIRRMDLYEEKNFVPKPVRRTHGNAFGL